MATRSTAMLLSPQQLHQIDKQIPKRTVLPRLHYLLEPILMDDVKKDNLFSIRSSLKEKLLDGLEQDHFLVWGLRHTANVDRILRSIFPQSLADDWMPNNPRMIMRLLMVRVDMNEHFKDTSFYDKFVCFIVAGYPSLGRADNYIHSDFESRMSLYRNLEEQKVITTEDISKLTDILGDLDLINLKEKTEKDFNILLKEKVVVIKKLNIESSRDVFRTHTGHLATCIGSAVLNRITDKLYANELISLDTKNDILTTQGASDSSKLVDVLDTMLNVDVHVAHDPRESFLKICNILIEIDHRPLTDIANSMLEQITTLEGIHKSDNDHQSFPLKQSKQSQIPNDDLISPGATAEVAVQPELQHGDKKTLCIGNEIRAYQWELIKPGLNGENYIICAPTGSGKTLMAACIIKDRLERGKNNAILFVVKTQQLAVQQKKKLEEYLKVSVVEITGDNEDAKIYSILPQVDIVVCTAGKLQSELISKSLNISDVSLLVMDECHHTIGRDPYAEIMEYYLMARRESLPTPQVIGMTASPGAGSAKNKIATLAKAIEHQTKLCARLDATSGIKIVKYNVEELKKYVKPPDYENHTLPQRAPNDPFIHLVSDTMGRLEQMLPVQPSIQPPTDRSSQAYQQWLKNEIDVAQLSGTDESDQRNQISILEQLEVYTLACFTYEDFEFEHAMEDLKDVIIKDDEEMNTTEKVIQDMHQRMLSQLSHITICPNPMLKRAEDLLYKHFSAKPDSKALFFVRDVKHTNYVTKWIKSSAKLESLVKPASIFGYYRKGMAIQDQHTIIDAFRSNKLNLLVSTSVLEEGLDIPECNMVIRFQMMTNEIAEVQAQGRARAENSTLHNITVSNSNTLHHRLLNIGRKEMARDAVDHLARHGIAKHRILDIQSHILSQREERIRAEVENKKRWKTQNVELHCRKCHNFACKATDVCQYGVHYIVPNTAFIEERMKKMRRKGGRAEPKEADGFTRPLKIGCKICGEEWGAWGVWENGIQCPLLKCEKFTYRNKQTGHRENCKKWKNIPFEVVFYDELIEEHNKEVDD